MRIKPWTRDKKIFVSLLTLFILILIGVRILASAIILKEVNKSLANSNETVVAHIDGMSMSLHFGSYRFEGLRIWLKGQTPLSPLVTIPVLQFSLSWEQLLHGRILSDAYLEEMEVTLSPRLVEVLADKDITTKMLHRLVLIDVNKVELVNCKISVENVAGSEEHQEFLTGIEGQLTNISNEQSQKRKVPSVLSLKGNLFGRAPLIVTAKYAPAKQRTDITLQAEGVPLVEANPPLESYVPLTFIAGTLDVWSEVVMEGSELKGYVKPFFRRVQVFKRNEKFISTKRLFVEIFKVISNLLLRDAEIKTTATMIEFTKKNGKVEIKTSDAVKKAVKNGYIAPIEPGFEPRYFPAKSRVQFE